MTTDNLLEKVARDIYNCNPGLPILFENARSDIKALAERQAKAALQCLADNLDEGAFETAAKTYWEKRNSKAEFTDMLTSVIKAYLNQIKESV